MQYGYRVTYVCMHMPTVLSKNVNIRYIIYVHVLCVEERDSEERFTPDRYVRIIYYVVLVYIRQGTGFTLWSVYTHYMRDLTWCLHQSIS